MAVRTAFASGIILPMSDHDALLAAIIANPDDDMPRLVYADWLDENMPDKIPSPAAGPSARAEYIRVQCRLAQYPFDEPDYPELLEREQDLARWLQMHAAKKTEQPALRNKLTWFGGFDSGESRMYSRGFPDEFEYCDYDDEPTVNVENIVTALPITIARTTLRTLKMEKAYGEEIAGVVCSPAVSGLRGLSLSDLDDDNGEAIRAIATSPHLHQLKRLDLDFDISDDELKELAKSVHLEALESLALDYPSPAGLVSLTKARWFCNLRSLRIWSDSRDAFKVIAAYPEMPNLVELIFRGSTVPTVAAMRKFVASDSFPQLKRLELMSPRLTPEHIAVLARGSWTLRHLTLNRVGVYKSGAESLAKAAFAESLRVLELPECEITAGGIQALASSRKLSELQHLDLAANPIGIGGLTALARSESLRGLRSLSLMHCNDVKALIDASAMLQFLTALDLPELRHLKLNRLPVGVRGARAIAAGNSFANLTRLSLNECGLRENGARAVVESHMLPNLTSLELADNAAGKGVAKLASAKVLPRLGHADVSRNRIPSSTLARLRKRPGVQV